MLKIIRLEKSSQSWKIIAKRRSKTISTNTLERRGGAVKVVTCDMSGAYIPIIKQLFPNAKIVLIQHLNRAMTATRIAIMNQVDKHELPYRIMKNHWRILHKDSRKLSDKRFYSRMLRETRTPKEIIEKALAFSDELSYYYELYQLLLFHF